MFTIETEAESNNEELRRVRCSLVTKQLMALFNLSLSECDRNRDISVGEEYTCTINLVDKTNKIAYFVCFIDDWRNALRDALIAEVATGLPVVIIAFGRDSKSDDKFFRCTTTLGMDTARIYKADIVAFLRGRIGFSALNF